MRRNQKKKKEKITKENKQTNSEIECTQVRGGFLGLGAGEYVQKPHKKNWGAKIEPAGCRQKLYFSGLCVEKGWYSEKIFFKALSGLFHLLLIRGREFLRGRGLQQRRGK